MTVPLTNYQIKEREFLIRVSYMEIYNEEINDLLAVENQKLQIHESLDVSLWLRIPIDFAFFLSLTCLNLLIYSVEFSLRVSGRR